MQIAFFKSQLKWWVTFIEHLLCARPCLEISRALTHFVLTTLCGNSEIIPFHGWGNWLSCSLGFPILSNGKDTLPLLKLSLVHCMLLVRNRSHSPMSTQKFRHHPILCSTGRSLKMGLPNSSAAPKTGPSTAYHNHLGSFWNKTQQRPGPHTLDVLGLPGALESLSSESCPGAFDTHQVWEHCLIQLAHCLVYCG